MRPKDKLNAALSPGGTTESPVVICYEDIYLRDHWKEVIPYPWWYQYSPDLNEQTAWKKSAIESIGQDWFYLPECDTRENRNVTKIVHQGKHTYLLDTRINEMFLLSEPVIGGWSKTKRVQSIHPEILPQTYKEIEHIIPDSKPFDKDSFVAGGEADLAHNLLSGCAADLFPIRHLAAPLWSCYHIWGFEDLMVKIATNADLVQFAAQRQLTHCIREIHASAAMGAEAIWIEDCYVDMISPKAFQLLNLPLIQALVSEIHSLNMKSIYYFCGDPTGKLDLLLETNTDALSLEESKKGFHIDIEEIATRVNGKCCLLGNLDAIHLLPNASKKELRNEITRQMNAGKLNQNRFIFSIGSPVTPGTTPEQVRLYTSLAHELGSIG